MAAWGLRTKSLLALVLACLLALVPAGLIGWQVMDGIRSHFGAAYARNTTLLNRERVFGQVSRELALSLRLARSEITRQWLLDEGDPAKRAMFFREAESYRQDFRDHSYNVAFLSSGHYYYNDEQHPVSDAPRNTLHPEVAHDSWFYNTLRAPDEFNLNVDHDVAINVTKVWFNVVVQDGKRRIGAAGTGLDLSTFIRSFIASSDVGVTPMILDRQGAIQAHPDQRLIAYNSGSQQGTATDASQVFKLLGSTADETALRAAMHEAEASPGSVALPTVTLSGKPQLLAITYIPELKWHIVTAVDLQAAQFIRGEWITPLLLALAALIGALFVGFAYAIDKLLLRPISQLRHSAQAIASGHYEVSLPQDNGDEIGELSHAFGAMADKVRHHTTELESKVRERTAELEDANRKMAAAHKQINDSIDYASLIQRAILPDRELVQSLGPHHFVLWRPRDVVGGDFYVFRADGDNCLLGVVDCAGHGVPGALMTMLARAAIDQAINVDGPGSPAAVLARTDAAMRAMLRDGELPPAIATSMDAGLCYIDRTRHRLLFAGAKISLYWSDGEQVEEVKGNRRSLGDRRQGDYHDMEVALDAHRTYYMVTDGFLDQAGGEHGFGFGPGRFAAMLNEHARLPLAEQGEAFEATLTRYRGRLPQRDDMTMLSFRFD